MTFKKKLLDRIFQYKFDNANNHHTAEGVTDEMIQLFDTALTELIVEERVNRRSICTKTIRKIREQILYLKVNENDDDGAEKVLPEPRN